MTPRTRTTERPIPTPILPLPLLVGCALLCSCADGRTASTAQDGGGPDSDADTDSEIVGDACENYPEADNDFLPGSVPRNYTFFDAADAESRLCDYADKKLALLVISEGES